jgi:hypothetical protein
MARLRYDIHSGVTKAKTRITMGVAALAVALGGGASLALIGAAHAAGSTVVITGDTATAENDPGWKFNRDTSTSTTFEFNTDQASIGSGSLYVEPIGSNPSDKLVAEDFVHMPVADLNSISYDFMIAGSGNTSDSDQFYLNVYAVTQNDNKFYDCRFDYVPATGSTAGFTTAAFASTDTPVNVQTSGTTRVTPCPTTLAGMPTGSYIRMFSLSVGDTSGSDAGLAGYLDRVVVDASTGVTTYDFEPALAPSSKDSCKKNGWMTMNSPTFKNQGECVSWVEHNVNSHGNGH